MFRFVNDDRRRTMKKLAADGWEKRVTRVTMEAMENFIIFFFASCDFTLERILKDFCVKQGPLSQPEFIRSI